MMFSQTKPRSAAINDTQLSKKLSWLLRHGAVKEHIPIQSNGYVSVESILKHPMYARHFTVEILEKIVSNDKKARYNMRRNPLTNLLEIRANQGHSLAEVHSDDCLERILTANSVPMAVHGTYYKNWENIKKEGLKRMNRNHVHFAVQENIKSHKSDPSHSQIISGFRNDCELLIYLNVEKILQDGRMEVYRSANNVVLCSGLGAEGCIPVEYFEKVVDRKTGNNIKF